MRIGKVTGSCYNLTNYDPVQSDSGSEYKALAQAGYITIKPEKRHVWNVSLTQAGQQAIKDAPYAHTQKADCDSWQVSLPLSTFQDLIVSGVLEDGPHAKANISVKWKVTPLGLALRKAAVQLKLSDLGTQVLVGDDLARLPVNATEYHTYRTILFDKYDDGWKIHYEPKAVAYTEAPEELLDIIEQRYRWSRGILQALRKQKHLLASTKTHVTTPLSLGTGAIRAGSLELSNVDISKEFTNMINASTGFSAASRVITTSNQLIQDLLNTSR